MASNIQLATTLVAPTGTGFLFVPFGTYGDSTKYIQSGATGRPAELTFKRTAPKPTSTFPGVDRGEIKLTEYETVNGVEYAKIFYFGCSMPVPIPTASRTAMATRGSLLLAHSSGVLLSDLMSQPSRIPV